MRVAVHVRPHASATQVGGEYDGAIVVRVRAAAERGRATTAALVALADALSLPRHAVSLVTGATSRRKLVEIDVPPDDEPATRRRLDRLRTSG